MVALLPELQSGIRWLDREEEINAFNRQVQEVLGISGEDFRRHLADGVYQDILDDPEHSDLMYLALLAESAR